MRFFYDSEELTTVKWFFTDRPFLPFPNIWTSRNWDADNGEWPEVFGEVQGSPRSYRKGAPPGPLPPGGPCGNPADWVRPFSISEAIG